MSTACLKLEGQFYNAYNHSASDWTPLLAFHLAPFKYFLLNGVYFKATLCFASRLIDSQVSRATKPDFSAYCCKQTSEMFKKGPFQTSTVRYVCSWLSIVDYLSITYKSLELQLISCLPFKVLFGLKMSWVCDNITS